MNTEYTCERCQFPISMGYGDCICDFLIAEGNCPNCVCLTNECVCEVTLTFHGIDITSYMTCPITYKCFTDPVTTVDGFTYERRAIEEWLEHHDTSPMTGLPLHSSCIIPNQLVRNILENCTRNARKIQT
jgi:hypothetical protein